jgi:hypothetical protein
MQSFWRDRGTPNEEPILLIKEAGKKPVIVCAENFPDLRFPDERRARAAERAKLFWRGAAGGAAVTGGLWWLSEKYRRQP